MRSAARVAAHGALPSERVPGRRRATSYRSRRQCISRAAAASETQRQNARCVMEPPFAPDQLGRFPTPLGPVRFFGAFAGLAELPRALVARSGDQRDRDCQPSPELHNGSNPLGDAKTPPTIPARGRSIGRRPRLSQCARCPRSVAARASTVFDRRFGASISPVVPGGSRRAHRYLCLSREIAAAP